MENSFNHPDNHPNRVDSGELSAPNYDDTPWAHLPGENDTDSDTQNESESATSTTTPTISYPLSLDIDHDEYPSAEQIHGHSVIKSEEHEDATASVDIEALAAMDIKKSCFQARLKRVEFGNWGLTSEGQNLDQRAACLIVLEVDFQPRKKGLRFSEAEVEVSFEDAPEFTSDTAIYKNPYIDGVYTGPIILKSAPTPANKGSALTHYLYSEVQPGEVPMVGMISSRDESTTGTKSGRGGDSASEGHQELTAAQVVWTVSEDKQTQNGIPRRCRFAVIVGFKQNKEIRMTVRMKAKFVGWRGVWPVKAFGGYHGAHIFFSPWGSVVDTRARVWLDENQAEGSLSPAKQANEPEYFAKWKGVIGGIVSIRRPNRREDLHLIRAHEPAKTKSPQGTSISELESRQIQRDHDAMYEWVTWLPQRGLDTRADREVHAPVALRNLREVDMSLLVNH